jgi:ribosomal protein L11 methyltransferase
MKKADRKKKRIASSWTGNVRTREVGQSLRLVPLWERGMSQSDRRDILIDPGPSFGAGDHPTTIMALEFLEEVMVDASRSRPFPSFLDVGTGVGVLAIAARLLGAGFTVGLDIDAAAVCCARRNAQLNAVTGPDHVEADHPLCWVESGPEAVNHRFDVVAANLAAPVLVRLHDHIASQAESWLVLSGIADAMEQEVVRVYGTDGLELQSTKSREGWNAAVFRRTENQ